MQEIKKSPKTSYSAISFQRPTDAVRYQTVVSKKLCVKRPMQADSQPQQQSPLENSMYVVLSSSRRLEMLLHYRRRDYRLIMWSEYTLSNPT